MRWSCDAHRHDPGQLQTGAVGALGVNTAVLYAGVRLGVAPLLALPALMQAPILTVQIGMGENI